MAPNVPMARNLVEPGFIVLAFTVGSLINRRRQQQDKDDVGLCECGCSTDGSPPLKPTVMIRSETAGPSETRDNAISRFLRTFPFLAEIWYWNLTYWVYQLLRAFSARCIAGNEATFARAQAHALSILRLERFFGIDVEMRVQQYILTNLEWLMPVLAKIYYSHISLGVCFIVYTYTYLPSPHFQRVRRTIAVDNAIAFCILTLWRCMPPRLLPEQYGYVDVLHGGKGGGSAWTHNKFQLTIAAMPSLHFGTALFLAYSIVRFSPHRFLRVLAPLWPIAMLVTIVATANHFLLDAAIGAMVPFLGWKLNRILLVLKPLQDRIVQLLGLRLEEPERRTVVGDYSD